MTRIPARCTHRSSPLLCSIRFHRDRADQLRDRMGLRHLPYRGLAERYPHRRSRLLHYWRHTHAHALKRYHHYQHQQAQQFAVVAGSPWSATWLSDALCVHHYEGAWNANTGNGYFGGFQADLSFQETYNPAAYRRWGTANNWPPHEQLLMAYRGWLARGWEPWPATAAMCGLL